MLKGWFLMIKKKSFLVDNGKNKSEMRERGHKMIVKGFLYFSWLIGLVEWDWEVSIMQVGNLHSFVWAGNRWWWCGCGGRRTEEGEDVSSKEQQRKKESENGKGQNLTHAQQIHTVYIN
jgi:hypothetical protein